MNFEKIYETLESFLHYKKKQYFSSRCVEYLKLYTDQDLDEFVKWVDTWIDPGCILNSNLVSLYVSEAKYRHIKDEMDQISYTLKLEKVKLDFEEKTIMEDWEHWYREYHVYKVEQDLAKSISEYGLRTTSLYAKTFDTDLLENVKAEIKNSVTIPENNKTKLFLIINSVIRHKNEEVMKSRERTYKECPFL